MFDDKEKQLDRPGLIVPDPEEARERKKATQTGKFVLGLAVVFLATAITAVFGDLSVVTFVATGFFIALLVVGLMILFAGERQRRRDAARRIAAVQKR
jgi:heme A synthase